MASIGESRSFSRLGATSLEEEEVGPDLEEEGEEGLLSIGESGEEVSLDETGNRLLMLNLPRGDTWAAEGGLTTARELPDDATKFPFTSCSNDPRMDEPPSAPGSLASDLLPVLGSLLLLGGEAGSELGVLRKRGLPTHC